MKTNTIPVDIEHIELAKKIQAGEIKGKIFYFEHEVVILDYNSKKYSSSPIRFVYLDKDEVDYIGYGGLYIKVSDEPQFKPFEQVLVRNGKGCWQCALFSHMSGRDDFPYFANDFAFEQCIPYEGNQELVGTTINTKKL